MPYRQVRGGIFLINHLCVKAQPMVGGTTPGLVIPASVRKQSEQANEEQANKQHPSVAST